MVLPPCSFRLSSAIRYVREILTHASISATGRYTYAARRKALAIRSPLVNLEADNSKSREDDLRFNALCCDINDINGVYIALGEMGAKIGWNINKINEEKGLTKTME
ncbi:MAG: hypothetical protein LBK63_08475 [Treponema sp.]|nr:hypothetical protein [Treponema sp.]